MLDERGRPHPATERAVRDCRRWHPARRTRRWTHRRSVDSTANTPIQLGGEQVRAYNSVIFPQRRNSRPRVRERSRVRPQGCGPSTLYCLRGEAESSLNNRVGQPIRPNTRQRLPYPTAKLHRDRRENDLSPQAPRFADRRGTQPARGSHGHLGKDQNQAHEPTLIVSQRESFPKWICDARPESDRARER
jgi:hypothetical protein